MCIFVVNQTRSSGVYTDATGGGHKFGMPPLFVHWIPGTADTNLIICSLVLIWQCRRSLFCEPRPCTLVVHEKCIAVSSLWQSLGCEFCDLTVVRLRAMYCDNLWSGIVVSMLASINEVNQRRAGLVLRWATMSQFSSRCQPLISVCNQPTTQGQLSLPSLRGR